jgi:ABC-2 type transport system permease protein
VNATDIITIARKDLWVAFHRRATRLTLVLFPLVVAIGLSFIVRRVAGRQGVSPALLSQLLEAFLFFFVVEAAVLPTAIAAYSLVGEKVERSLEPLLATPVTDRDMLLGKAFAAWLPTVVATWVGAVIFMIGADWQTRSTPGAITLPNAASWVILALVIPLTALASVLLCVLVSVRATDVRSAQQAAALVVLPFAGIYVLSEVGLLTLDPPSLLWLALALAGADVILFLLARGVFDREEILTRWR